MSDLRQVIVVRRDLGMSTGKIAAQVAHAAMKATLTHMDHPDVVEWLDGAFTKIVVGVKSETALLNVIAAARFAGLIAESICDAGRTEVEPNTLTCAAIGPASPEVLAPITGKLQLLA